MIKVGVSQALSVSTSSLCCLTPAPSHQAQFQELASGLRVVRSLEASEERVANKIREYLSAPGSKGLGPGITARDAASLLGLALPLALHELEKTEARGLLCRDLTPANELVFYRNFFLEGV